jgi:hypothetical protein
MNHRTRRLLGALALTSTLFGLALAGPVSAKKAPLTVVATNASPSVVTQGQLGAFHFVVSNPGPSNISQLYLTEKSGANLYQVVGDRSSGCNTSGQLLCNFGALNAGASFTFDVALIAPSVSTWHVDFEFSSTGYVLGGNNSHGDLFSSPFDVVTASTSDTVDAAGTYVWDAAHQSFHNGLALGNNNKQSTSVSVFDTTFPASAADGANAFAFTCGTGFNCPGTFFGQVSQVDVDNGTDHLIHIVLQLYKPGKNPSNVNGVYHQWTDGTGTHEERITTVCDGGNPPGTVPCFLATKLGSNNLQLDIWAPHNGKYGGF